MMVGFSSLFSCMAVRTSCVLKGSLLPPYARSYSPIGVVSRQICLPGQD